MAKIYIQYNDDLDVWEMVNSKFSDQGDVNEVVVTDEEKDKFEKIIKDYAEMNDMFSSVMMDVELAELYSGGVNNG